MNMLLLSGVILIIVLGGSAHLEAESYDREIKLKLSDTLADRIHAVASITFCGGFYVIFMALRYRLVSPTGSRWLFSVGRCWPGWVLAGITNT